MRVGVSVTIPRLDAPGCLGAARSAVDAGASFVAFGEAAYDPVALAAAMTGMGDVDLIAGIVRWDREPVSLARAATTVAELGERPYRLGVGPGPLRGPHPGSLARLRRYLTDLRAALGDDDSVRLLLAAAGPGTARLAGELADGVLLSRVHSPARLREVLLPAISAGEGRARRIERLVLVRCAVSDTEASGVRVVRQALGEYELPLLARMLAADAHDLELSLRLRAEGDLDEAAQHIPECLVRGLSLVGPPRSCCDQLESYADMDGVVLFPCGPTPHAAIAGALQLLREIRRRG